MSTRPPLGQREDQHLEFKAMEVLRDPARIGREVVAMLNAKEGEVWIGIQEEDGIARAVQDVHDAHVSMERLREHLTDTIAPRPARELTLEVIEHAAGHCLRILVSPEPERQPYAQLAKGGQFYWQRIGSFLRPMTQEEVLARARGKSISGSGERWIELQRKRASEGFKGLWIALVPERTIAYATDKLRLEELVRDPSETQSAGWSLFSPWSVVDSLQGAGGGWIVHQGDALRSEIRRDGVLELTAQATALEHGVRGVIDPRALMRLTLSFLQLAGKLLKGSPETRIHLVAALFGARDLELRPFSHDAHGYGTQYPGHRHRRFEVARDLLLEPALVSLSELVDHPQACGYRLLLRMYEGYGYEPDELPRELDRASGEIRL